MKDIKLKHIKLLNKPDERSLPLKACTQDICYVIDRAECPVHDTCWWDYASDCNPADSCTIDHT